MGKKEVKEEVKEEVKKEVKKESLNSRAKTIYKTVHSLRGFRIETVQYFIAPCVHIYDSCCNFLFLPQIVILWNNLSIQVPTIRQ
jgi:hypothetical protein